MKLPLLWKLLAVNAIAIGLVMVIVYLSIGYRAADYFMALMDMYNIDPTLTHQLFLDAVYRALGWATIVGLLAATLLGYLLTRRLLKPLSQMTRNTARIASGDYEVKIDANTHDEVGQLARAFNSMAESLEHIQELRKSMVIDVAHELRTPLTNIRGYLEAIQDGIISPDHETIESLHEETLHLAKLVEDILQLARADAAKTHLQRQPTDLHALIEDVLSLFKPQLDEKSIQPEFHRGAHPPEIAVDPQKIAQVCRNLLQNAVQYAPSEGRVRIQTEVSNGEMRISVANSGVGISKDELPYIFERFYRADKSRSRLSGGAGIGLAIVKELVEAHGGHVGAESTDALTRIWFSLPTQPPAA